MKASRAKFFDNGIMVLDKPVGISSYQALAKVKRKLVPQRIGHTGTLDPFASGVLVLLFNQATRLADLFQAGEKTYVGELVLGASTDSGDFTGQITEEKPVGVLTVADIEKSMGEMTGTLMQSPPMYSAAKHQGRALYSYARQGEKVEKPPRRIMVKSTKLLSYEGNVICFKMVCGSGVYVRSWAEDLAIKLGTVGHLRALRREENGPFKSSRSISAETVENLPPDELAKEVMPVKDGLDAMGVFAVKLDAEASFRLSQGVLLRREDFNNAPPSGLAYVLNEKDQLVAVINFLDSTQGDPGKEYETIRVFNNKSSAPA